MTKQEVVQYLEYLSDEAKRIALDDTLIDTEYQTLIASWEEFKSRFKADPLLDKAVSQELSTIENSCDLQQVEDRTQLLGFLSVFSRLALGVKQYRNKKRREKLMKFSTETSSSAFNIKMKSILK